jgi:hypothetical protein
VRAGITRAAARMQSLHTLSGTVTRATAGTGINTGHPDWGTPTTIGTVQLGLQPATTEAQLAAGLTVSANRVSLYLTPPAFAIEPITHRITIGSVTYAVLTLSAWPSHWHAIAERA